MTELLPLRCGIFILLVLLTMSPVPAQAQTLDELRVSGAVGERYDGFAAVREAEPSDELKANVEEINSKRQKVYEKRAAEQGVSVEQVGRVYAGQIYESAPAGTWFLQESGEWVQKEAE